MAHHKLREDKKCQNCGFIVRRRFCPKCGQENIETRQSFFYLFTHFIEDLVHYDGSFWKTLKHLLFKPGLLTKEYLSGKRKTYVPPVKLYIFVSFFVFFVGGIINKLQDESEITNLNFNTAQNNQNVASDSLALTTNNDDWGDMSPYKTLREYDSIQNSLPEIEKDNWFEKKLNTKFVSIKEKYSFADFQDKLKELALKNIPKFLFLYMPFFAFFMWLFHSKKKWYYFDHGIFTLHYFSFLLLSWFFSNSIVAPLLSFFDYYILNFIIVIFFIATYIWMFLYFFKAHKKVYQYSKLSTLIRGLFLLGINTFFLIIGIIVYMIIIFYLL